MLAEKIRMKFRRFRKLITRKKSKKNDDYEYTYDCQPLLQRNDLNDEVTIYVAFKRRNELIERMNILKTTGQMSEFSDNSLSIFANLPDVPLLKVFSYLSGAQVLQLHLVCKRWRWLVMSAANQLPKHHMDFSLVFTENPYAEIPLKNCETEAKSEQSFQCHLESMQKEIYANNALYANFVGQRVSHRLDLQIDDDGTCPQLHSYQHFAIKQIAFQSCMPSAELLEAIRIALRRRRPSMLRFDDCTLSSDIEMPLIKLLAEFKSYMKIIVFKACPGLDGVTNNFIEELDRMEQFFVDPHSAQLLSVTDAALERISRQFQIQPFHLTLPRQSFTENGVQEFFKAITSEDNNVLQDYFPMNKFTLPPNAASNNLSLTCSLTSATLAVSPSSLVSTCRSPDYERNDYFDDYSFSVAYSIYDPGYYIGALVQYADPLAYHPMPLIGEYVEYAVPDLR